MLCKRCKKRQAQGIYCRPCFIDVIDKRIRKHIRSSRIRNNDRVLAMDPVSRHFLKKMPAITIVSRPKSLFSIKRWDISVCTNQALLEYIKKNNISSVMLPLTVEYELASYLGNMFAGRAMTKGKDPVFISLPLTKEELSLFCGYMKIRFSTRLSDDINIFLDKMEQRFPGSKFSFYNALVALRP